MLYFKHGGRNVERHVDEFDRRFVMPLRAVFARNGMSVRTCRGFVEKLREPAFDHRRNRVLEPAGLGTRQLPRYSEMIDEQPLCQSLAAQGKRADERARHRGRHAVSTFVGDVALGIEALEHCGRRRRGHSEFVRDGRSRHRIDSVVEPHDRLQVHLDVWTDFVLVRLRGRR